MSARIAVTGAGGFIGASIVAALREAGCEVVAVGRRPLPGIDVLADSRDPEALLRAFRGVSSVVDAAGVVPGRGDPSDNPRMARALSEAALRGGISRIVHLGSSAVWGVATRVEAGTPPAPVSAYAQSKLAAERVLLGVEGAAVTVLRLATVYGPGMGGWLGRLLRWSARGVPLPFAAVNAPRPYLALANVALWVRWCLENPSVVGCHPAVDLHIGLAALLRTLVPEARLFRVPLKALTFGAGLAGRGGDWQRLSRGQLIVPSDDGPELHSAERELLRLRGVIGQGR